MRHWSLVIRLFVVIAGGTVLGAAAASAQGTFRVSTNALGVPGDSESSEPSISGNGRHVAFVSYASNLVSGDTNQTMDVFVKDRLTGEVERVNVGPHGEQTESWANSLDPVLSADGRYVAFVCDSWDITEPRGGVKILIRDRWNHTLTAIAPSPTLAPWGTCDDPSISADGRFVAFTSDAPNLVPNDTNGYPDAFLYDQLTRTITRVSVSSSGAEQNGIDTGWARVSGDGRFVAFQSDANNLDPRDTDGLYDVYVHDRLARTTQVVSRRGDGGDSWWGCMHPAISHDGRFIAFEGVLAVPGDGRGGFDWRYQVYVLDRRSGRNTCASEGMGGWVGNDHSRYPDLSADGRFVAFTSEASDLVPGDTNGVADTFLHDRITRTTERVSVGVDGQQANGDGGQPMVRASLSRDGRFVAFDHADSGLVPGGYSWSEDVYVHGPYLSLSASPETVPRGQSLSLTMWTGKPGDPLVLALVDVSGVPLFQPVASGRFGVRGSWSVAGTPPAALQGTVVTFLGLGVAPSGRLERTGRQAVVLE